MHLSYMHQWRQRTNFIAPGCTCTTERHLKKVGGMMFVSHQFADSLQESFDVCLKFDWRSIRRNKCENRLCRLTSPSQPALHHPVQAPFIHGLVLLGCVYLPEDRSCRETLSSIKAHECPLIFVAIRLFCMHSQHLEHHTSSPPTSAVNDFVWS